MADDFNNVTGIDDSRLYAAMSYLTILVFIPWLTRRADPFVNWHVRQGLVVFAGMVLALIAAIWSPAFGSLLFLLLLIGNVIALVQALQGMKWKIPGVGQLADKIRV